MTLSKTKKSAGVRRIFHIQNYHSWIIGIRTSERGQERLEPVALGMIEDVRRALLGDHALVHKDHAIRYVMREGHLMRDHDHGHVFVGERLDDLEHLAGQLGVERGGRLIKAQDLGLHRQRARDRHALLLPAGELAGVVPDLLPEPHALDQLHRLGFDLFVRALAEQLGRQRDVIQHAVLREEIEVLEHQTEVQALFLQFLFGGALADGGVKDHVAVDDDLALVGELQRVETAQQRRLAGAGGTDDGQHLALLEGEVDALEDFGLAEALIDIFHFQNCHTVAPLDLEVAQLLLEPSEQQGQDAGEGEIVDAGEEQRPHDTADAVGAVEEVVSHPDQLLHGDDLRQGGILDEGDDLVGHRRHDTFDHLQQGDAEEDLLLRQTEHLTRLMLTDRHSLNASSEYLGEVAGVVDDERHDRRPEATRIGAAPQDDPEHHAGHIVDDQQLEHQRRAAHDPHQHPDRRRDHLEPAHGAERDDQTQRDGAEQRQREEPQRVDKAPVQ